MKISNTIKGAACVSGAFLINFTLGTMYTFGNMSPYISSYLRLRTNNTSITTGDTVWVLAANFIFMGVFMPVGGLLDKKIGSRLTCLFGSWTMSLNVIMTYFTIKKNLLLVTITYGIFFGFGLGISYSVALATAMKWFPLQRGMISGIVVGGFGLGSLLFNLLQTKYINPLNIPPTLYNPSNLTQNSWLTLNSSSATLFYDNITKLSKEKYFFDEDLLNNVPNCFVLIGIIYAIMQLIGVILLMDPESKNQKKDVKMEDLSGNNQDVGKELLDESVSLDKEKHDLVKKNIESSNYSISEALKNRRFWHLVVTFFLNGLVIVTITAVYKSFGQQFISDDQYFAVLGAVGGICNCFGRVFWGRLYDMFNYRIIMSALTILMAVTIGTFYFCSFIPNIAVAKAIYFIWGCLLFVAHAGSFAILPSATAQCFGSKNLATIYGLVFCGLALASLLGAIVSSFFFNVLQYKGQFIIATIAALLSLVLTQFFQPIVPKEVIEKNNTEKNRIETYNFYF